MIKKFLFIGAFIGCTVMGMSQEKQEIDAKYSDLTFSTVRIVNGQSVETTPHGKLLFLISHHFGDINQGFDEFFGLDQSTVRLGFEYGFSSRFAMGIGRSSYNKIVDGFLKYKLFRQTTDNGFPFTLSYYGNIAIDSRKQEVLDIEDIYASRYQSVQQLLIARKFNDKLSLQLSPTFIMRNMQYEEDNVWAMGFGSKYKLSYRSALNFEYFYLFPGKTADKYRNAFSIGWSIKAGGHAFQMYISNALGMVEQLFIPRSMGNWSNGQFHFGFNISRAFIIKETKEYKDELYW